MTRLSLLVLVAVVGGALAALLALSSGPEEKPGRARSAAPRAVDISACRGLGDDAGRDCYTRRFLATVEGVDDPRPAVKAIADAAWRGGSFLRSNCHGIMHTVGRTYAVEAGLT